MAGFEIIADSFGDYLSGFVMTIFLTVVSLICGLLLAITFCVVKYRSIPFVVKPIDALVFYFRGTPCLIQIYLVYYGLAQFEWMQDSWLWIFFKEPIFCALFALSLNTAAYSTEFIYGAILVTSKGEIEAAKSFGFSSLNLLKRIIFPSVIRRVIPLYANEAIFLMQATALASTITVVELTQVARITNSRHFIPFEAFMTAAVFYMITSYSIYYCLNRLEKKLRKPSFKCPKGQINQIAT